MFRSPLLKQCTCGDVAKQVECPHTLPLPYPPLPFSRNVGVAGSGGEEGKTLAQRFPGRQTREAELSERVSEALTKWVL